MTTAAQATAAEAFVAANGLRIRYRDVGEGPPLVLLHGGLATGDMWSEPVIADLALRHRVLIPDSRAHGGTDNPAGTLRYDQMADDVAAFCAALGVERPFIVGYSDGAQIALEIGLRHPALAMALVMGGVVTRPSEAYQQMLREWGFLGRGQIDLAVIEPFMGDFYPVLRTAHRHALHDAGFHAYLTQISELWFSVPDYTDAQLVGIGVPSLVIVGDRDHPSLDESLRLYRLLPHGELAVVPKADHGAGEKKVFWDLVADFLLRHTPREPNAA